MTAGSPLAEIARRLAELGSSNRDPSEVAQTATQLLSEAIREGEFFGEEYVELQLAVLNPSSTDLKDVQTDWLCYQLAHGNPSIVAWDDAIRLLLPRLEMSETLAELRTFDFGRSASWVNACRPVAALIQGRSKGSRRKRTDPNEANIRARELLKIPTVRKRLSARKLAKLLDCSWKTAANLPVFLAYKEENGQQRKRSAPRVVGLTDAVLANEGQEDEKLQELIAEQAADFEPSPVVPSHKKFHRLNRRKL